MTREPLDRDELDDYVAVHGGGTPTAAGYALAADLWALGSDYATIAHEIAYRGHTKTTPREYATWETPAVTRYWLAHYVGKPSLCSLCGNTGIVDTRATAQSPTGYPAGRLNYCICPNGQAMRTNKTPLEKIT